MVPCDGDGVEGCLGHSGVKRRQEDLEETSIGACAMDTGLTEHKRPQGYPAMAAAFHPRGHVVLPPRRV